MKTARLKKEMFHSIVFIMFFCIFLAAPAQTQTPEAQRLTTSTGDSDSITILKIENTDPFHPETQMSIKVENPCRVSISICTPMGSVVRDLVSTKMQPGVHIIRWDGKDNSGDFVSSGVYLLHVQSQHCKKIEALALL